MIPELPEEIVNRCREKAVAMRLAHEVDVPSFDDMEDALEEAMRWGIQYSEHPLLRVPIIGEHGVNTSLDPIVRFYGNFIVLLKKIVAIEGKSRYSGLLNALNSHFEVIKDIMKRMQVDPSVLLERKILLDRIFENPLLLDDVGQLREAYLNLYEEDVYVRELLEEIMNAPLSEDDQEEEKNKD